MTRVTKHATKRIRTRLGLPKHVSEKNADKAFRNGIRHKETTGSLHRYMDFLFFQNQNANNIRIYHNFVYIFAGKTLITVFDLPNKYKKAAARLQDTARRGEIMHEI